MLRFNVMQELFDITGLISTYGYIGIFIIVFLESGIFFALPGDSLLFTAGMIASAHVLSIYKLIPLIFVSTFLGALAGYEIGLRLEFFNKYKLWRKIVRKEHLEKTEKFFGKYGKFTIIISRFVPIVRTFVPIVAGLIKMDYKRFIKFSLIGSALWSTTVTLVGYFVGRIIPEAEKYLSLLIVIVVVLSLLPIIYKLIKKEKD